MINNFLQPNGTLSFIEALNGRTLTDYTNFPDHEEVILVPGSELIVVANSLQCPGILVVHLREVIDDSSATTLSPSPAPATPAESIEIVKYETRLRAEATVRSRNDSSNFSSPSSSPPTPHRTPWKANSQMEMTSILYQETF